jgi:hypothetical protein
LTETEAASLIADLRQRYRFQGPELKSKNLRKRADWDGISSYLVEATRGRTKVVFHNKRMALAGKFVEYFFEPVLSENNSLFYGVNFHRYLMTAIYLLMKDGEGDFPAIASQMQEFMKTFDPAVAPEIFTNQGHPTVEGDRILRFCRGYKDRIANETALLRPENSDIGKWTLDLTSTCLFSLLFFGWGNIYPRLRLLCDDSKPLLAGASIFNGWVGKDRYETVTDGRKTYEIRGNLVSPVEFGSSDTHPTIQVADLVAGLTLDTVLRGQAASTSSRAWLAKHLLHTQSIEFESHFADKSQIVVKVGREILKELARRAEAAVDPLDGMDAFVEKTLVRFR